MFTVEDEVSEELLGSDAAVHAKAESDQDLFGTVGTDI